MKRKLQKFISIALTGILLATSSITVSATNLDQTTTVSTEDETGINNGPGFGNSDTNKGIEYVTLTWRDATSSTNQRQITSTSDTQLNDVNTYTAYLPGYNDSYVNKDTAIVTYNGSLSFAMSGTYQHQAFTIEARIPAHLFTKRNSTEYADEFISWPIPTKEEAETNPNNYTETSLCYYYDSTTNEYVITNFKNVEGGYKGHVDFTLSVPNPCEVEDGIQINPGTIPSAENIAAGHKEALTVTVNLLDQDNKVSNTKQSNTLYCQLDTGTKLSSTYKYAKQVSKWISSWGTEPETNGKDYMYIMWPMEISLDNQSVSQPYSLWLTDLKSNLYVNDENGNRKDVDVEMVGYHIYHGFSSSSSTYIDTIWKTMELDLQPVPEDGVIQVVDESVARLGFGNTPKVEVVYLVTRVEEDQLENNDVIHNSESVLLKGIDDGIAQTDDASAKLTYTKTEFEEPSGWYNISKYGDHEGYIEYSELAKGNDIDISKVGYTYNGLFASKVSVNGFSLTKDETAEGSGYELYNKKSYTISHCDDMLFFVKPDENGRYPTTSYIDQYRLNAQDYSISEIIINANNVYDYVYNETYGKYDYVSANNKDITHDLYVKMATADSTNVDDLEWVYIGSLQKNYTTLVVDPAYEGKIKKDGYKICFDDSLNVVGIRSDITTTHSKFENLWLKIEKYKLKYTDHIQSLMDENPTVQKAEIRNVSTLNIYDSNNNLVTINPKEAYFSSYSAEKNYVKTRDNANGATLQQSKHATATNRIYPSAETSEISKSLVKQENDIANRQVVLSYQVEEKTTWKDAQNMDINYLINEGVIRPNYTGTFYDLLPLGVDADLDTVQVTAAGNDERGSTSNEVFNEIEVTSKKVVENWRDTGRTMLIVEYQCPMNGDTYDYSKFIHNGVGYYRTAKYQKMVLSYNALYSWDMVADFGKELKNLVAFETGNHDEETNGVTTNALYIDSQTNKAAYADNGETFNSFRNLSTEEKEEAVYAYTDVNDDGKSESRYLYAMSLNTITANTYTSLALCKTVKGIDNTDFTAGQQDSVQVPANSEYYYQIRLGSESNTNTKNIVLYDSLENYVPVKNEKGQEEEGYGGATWKGTFVSVDTTQAERRGIKPVIYYSDIENLVIEENHNILDDSVWHLLTSDVDKSTVKAIAIDLSKDKNGNDYVLKENDTLNIKIKMLSPEDPELVHQYVEQNAHAYNNIYADTAVCNKNTDGSGTAQTLIHQNYTQVLLRETNINIEKTSDPESGTSEVPTIVEEDQEINYDIKVVNNENNITFNNMKVVDVLPDGLELNTEKEISIYTGTDSNIAVSINDSDLATVTTNGQKLTFTINTLATNEEIHLVIPTIVKHVTETTSYENTAIITEYDSGKLDIESNTTYHEQPKTSVEVQKNWEDDNDKYGIRPEYIIASLYADYQDGNGPVDTGKTVKLNAKNQWTDCFENLDVQKDGTTIVYSVEEIEVDGYDSAIVQTDNNKFEITNTVVETEIRISKTNVDGEEIEGAELVITSTNGKEIDRFFSIEGTTHYLNVTPGDYVLTEENAPDGYEIAEPISFTVDEEGHLILNGENTEDNLVTMVDLYTPEPEEPEVTPTPEPEEPEVTPTPEPEDSRPNSPETDDETPKPEVTPTPEPENPRPDTPETDDETTSESSKHSVVTSTGDSQNLVLWGTIFTVAVSLLFVLSFKNRSKKS